MQFLVEHVSPGAYALDIVRAPYDRRLAIFNYYSFVTLTTLGYGEITPLSEVARQLAVKKEALVGQLFPAVLLARLVSMEIASRK